MRYLIKSQLALAMLLCLSGCFVPAYDTMPATQVAQMSDADLCLAKLHTAVGFVPMEIERRRLSCDDRKSEVLDRLYETGKEHPFRFRSDHVAALIPYKCDGIEASLTRAPDEISESFLGGVLTRTNPYQYELRLRNRTAKKQYIRMTLYYKETEQTSFLIGRVEPRSEQRVPILRRYQEPDWRRDSGCYAV